MQSRLYVPPQEQESCDTDSPVSVPHWLRPAPRQHFGLGLCVWVLLRPKEALGREAQVLHNVCAKVIGVASVLAWDSWPFTD